MWKVCIDLFCGTGGFSHGWIQAGGKVAVAVDVWAEALENHKHNHPKVPILQMELGGDIPKTIEILKEYLKPFGEGVHVHIHGSPPCQALSTANVKTSGDEGMVLVNWFLELVEAMKPDSWSMENVVPVAKRLPDSIRWVKLCSADFGVPQKRYRIFAGEGWKAEPTHSKENWVSVIEAIPSLIGHELSPAPSMLTRWKELSIKSPFPTITSQSQNQIRIQEVFVNTAGNGPSASRRAVSVDSPINQPSKTLASKGATLRVKENGEYRSIRSLTIDEAAIIQGWPNMKFKDGLKKKDMRLMVGNMVSPPVAQAICEGIQ